MTSRISPFWALAFRRLSRLVFFCAVLSLSGLCLTYATPARAKEKAPMSAADLMRMLPTSIFDNSPEPISQDGLDLLLTHGYNDSWVVVENKQDSLSITAVGDIPGEVQVQVLRVAPRSIIILGARTNDSCAVELWEYKARGGLVPYAGPADPPAPEFFAQAKPLPVGLFSSSSLCLESGMLEAVPRFWNQFGPVDLTPDNRVFYIWNGKDFVKRVVPVADAGVPALSPAPPDRPTPGLPSSGGAKTGEARDPS